MSTSEADQQLEEACQIISHGRILARQLAKALHSFGLNESEFRLLWLLRNSDATNNSYCLDQRSIAALLGLSPAQVSTTVEKLRQQGIVESLGDGKDRRRQLWQLTAAGSNRVSNISHRLNQTCQSWNLTRSCKDSIPSEWEDAA